MNEIESLKELLTKHRQRFHGKIVRKFPQDFWDRVLILAQTISPEKIAFDLGINLGNLKRKIAQNGPIQKSKNQFVEVPFSASESLKKQMIIELPHNIKMRIDL